MLEAAHERARAGRRQPVGDEDRPRRRRRRRSSGLEAVTDDNVGAAEPRWHRVAVAPKATVALSATMRSTSIVAGNGTGGRASSGSASASSPTVVRSRPALCARGSSPVVAQNRSRERWASSGVVAAIVRHHRPETKRTDDSTEPLRFPRRGGHGSTTAP